MPYRDQRAATEVLDFRGSRAPAWKWLTLAVLFLLGAAALFVAESSTRVACARTASGAECTVAESQRFGMESHAEYLTEADVLAEAADLPESAIASFLRGSAPRLAVTERPLAWTFGAVCFGTIFGLALIGCAMRSKARVVIDKSAGTLEVRGAGPTRTVPLDEIVEVRAETLVQDHVSVVLVRRAGAPVPVLRGRVDVAFASQIADLDEAIARARAR